MKIALMGFTFTNPNKGCEALTYSFVNILKELELKNIEIYSFGYTGIGNIIEEYTDIKFHAVRHNLKNPIYWIKLKRMFDQMDCIFDITYGDGFSDIYGKKWNIITNIAKQIAVFSKTPFVLLPQTYGPYYNRFLKKWAYSIISKADLVFARDLLSAEEINKKIGNIIIPVTDLAFALPYSPDKYIMPKSQKTRIGINVSALLWEDGHSDTIKLKMNYREYCRQLVKELLKLTDMEIHIIPHVIDEYDYGSSENDMRICELLHKEFSATILAPPFKSAIDAKGYISCMDAFVGARMHSTIGAFSSGVATIPVSYSKKFEGLFGNLNYSYIISAVSLSEDEAVAKTLSYINQRDILIAEQKRAMNDIEKKLYEVNSLIEKYLD